MNLDDNFYFLKEEKTLILRKNLKTEDLEPLKNIILSSNVEFLHVNNGIEKTFESLLPFLENNTSIEYLNLFYYKINPSQLTNLVQSIPKLISLHLTRNGLYSQGLKSLLNCLKYNNRLNELSFSIDDFQSSLVFDNSIIEFLSTNQTLSILVLRSNSINDESLDYLMSGLLKNKSITFLDVSQNAITLKGLTGKFQNYFFSSNSSVQTLIMSQMMLKDDEVGLICLIISNNSSVTHLDLSNNYFQSFDKINKLLKSNPRIKKLDLQGSIKNYTGFSKKIENHYLSELNIGYSSSLSSNDSYASILLIFQYLKVLNLENCHIKIQEAKALFKNLSFHEHLQNLVYNNNLLNEECCIVLSEIIRHNSSLKEVHLCQCDLSNETQDILLKGLAENKSIKYMDLYNNSQVRTKEALSLVLTQNKVIENLKFEGFMFEVIDDLSHEILSNFTLLNLNYLPHSCDFIAKHLEFNEKFQKLKLHFPFLVQQNFNISFQFL